jgi:2-methylisocitrate lyase-like PEP mutase family enzyme
VDADDGYGDVKSVVRTIQGYETAGVFGSIDLFDMGFSQVAFPNILIGRVAKAVEQGLHRLSQLAAGKDSAFKNGEQEMALQSLVEAIDLKKWNALEKKYR